MTDNTLYKRLAKAEAMAQLQKSELTETLQAAYERACADENAQDAAAYARKLRDRLLAESDSEMSIDRLGLTAPGGSTFTVWLSFLRKLGDVLTGSWANYRKALRDLPEQEGFPFNITFPERPDSGNTPE